MYTTAAPTTIPTPKTAASVRAVLLKVMLEATVNRPPAPALPEPACAPADAIEPVDSERSDVASLVIGVGKLTSYGPSSAKAMPAHRSSPSSAEAIPAQ